MDWISTEVSTTYCRECKRSLHAYTVWDGFDFKGSTSNLKYTTGTVDIMGSNGKVASTKTYNNKAEVTKGIAYVYTNGKSDYGFKKKVEVKCQHGVLKDTYEYALNYATNVESVDYDYFSLKYDMAGGVIPDGSTYATKFYFPSETATKNVLGYYYKATRPVKLGYQYKGFSPKTGDSMLRTISQYP